jgi:hypothetical protein
MVSPQETTCKDELSQGNQAKDHTVDVLPTGRVALGSNDRGHLAPSSTPEPSNIRNKQIEFPVEIINTVRSTY